MNARVDGKLEKRLERYGLRLGRQEKVEAGESPLPPARDAQVAQVYPIAHPMVPLSNENWEVYE